MSSPVMAGIVLLTGSLAAALLLALLLGPRFGSPIRLWPPAEKGTWRSMLFWSLFRTLNTAAVLLAGLNYDESFLGLPLAVRAVGIVAMAASLALYLHACVTLGRGNTYGGRNGLVVGGIYRWTRNPQYATIIPAYVAVAVAADAGGVYLLAAALVAVYVLMALAEEPWLRAAYPGTYERYARAVPRFFNGRRARALGRLTLGQVRREAAAATRQRAFAIHRRKGP